MHSNHRESTTNLEQKSSRERRSMVQSVLKCFRFVAFEVNVGGERVRGALIVDS